ncbi:MAG: rhodanese-like domain-containing protein [Phycisphaerae bacterium]|nr:rhodanese-like domain-containing protein [Phycisphaerae bacterium]MCZ2399576.1 rhodanese-like domain-containing protein [Phycisphaerae bacterium]NUQ49045.1 rhodanese-like domain-containing protein [Phycisphaerae bacterium]
MWLSTFRIAVILVASSAVGAGVAQWRGLPWIPDRAEIERKDAAAERSAALRARHGVDLATFRDLIASGAIVIDARPAGEFEKGHLLIESYPPVLNVDAERAAYQRDRLEQLHGQPIVIYCTSLDCHLAEELMIELEQLGFDLDMIRLFPEGWEGLLKAGLPTTSGPDTWKGYDDLLNMENGERMSGDETEVPAGVGDGDGG